MYTEGELHSTLAASLPFTAVGHLWKMYRPFCVVYDTFHGRCINRCRGMAPDSAPVDT